MESAKRVALGMSGGVDSSIAVVLLQHHGYEVVGVTCSFEDDERARRGAAEARAVSDLLGIEHVVRDCSEAFRRRVIEPFVRDYERGLTPSPCVGCNACMKVPELMAAADELKCDYVATGHYARVNRMGDTGRYAILRALDDGKDQSYMLASLSQDQLARLVLPLGGMTKLAVRSLAYDLDLPAADAPESQDICFAPGGYRALLAAYGVEGKPGDIVNASGEVVGSHGGLFDFTVGQRKGIGVAGPEPYYVTGKNVAENKLIIGTAQESLIGSVEVGATSWQAIEEPRERVEAMVKLRYRSTPCPCIIEPKSAGRMHVELLSPQPATAPGQFAVFYQGSSVLGGGVIEEVNS